MNEYCPFKFLAVAFWSEPTKKQEFKFIKYTLSYTTSVLSTGFPLKRLILAMND